NAVCANLDANGLLFVNGGKAELPASGWTQPGSCIPPGPPGSWVRGTSCTKTQMRSVFYGLLGPQAASVTYSLGGPTLTLRPAGPEGAYLIVGPPLREMTRYGFSAIASPVPELHYTPITAITYRDGSVCEIAKTRPVAANPGCMRGYVPVQQPKPTRA